MASVYSQDSTGRVSERSGQSQAGVFKYNRKDMSFTEMQFMPRSDGDLFAVFQDDFGSTRVQYARAGDYGTTALNQINNTLKVSVTESGEAWMFVIGSIIISRAHNYSLHGFVNLLDHNLEQIFDLHGLVDWVSNNPDFFVSEVDEAVEEDAFDIPALEAEMARQDEAK